MQSRDSAALIPISAVTGNFESEVLSKSCRQAVIEKTAYNFYNY
jgi:hypothetical protein